MTVFSHLGTREVEIGAGTRHHIPRAAQPIERRGRSKIEDQGLLGAAAAVVCHRGRMTPRSRGGRTVPGSCNGSTFRGRRDEVERITRELLGFVFGSLKQGGHHPVPVGNYRRNTRR